MRKTLVLTGAVLVLGMAAAGWWMVGGQEVTVDSLGDQVQTLRPDRLPVFAEPPDVGRLYAFAVQNPDTLRWIPCTCGCGDLGHTSNRACYVKGETATRVTFTSHAAT